MRYYSTRNRAEPLGFAGAALMGLAPEGGLFIPEAIPPYPQAVRSSLASMNFHDIAFETVKPYVDPEIPGPVLEDIIHAAYPFRAPLVPVGNRLVLELFHGPTAAFKDFGARFMARAFSYLRRGETRPLHILVATSGDTGGAVADGFYGVEGIAVTVLYPKGRVTPLQERQIAGLGGNISALAVEGSFDDCQALVKAAFRNETLRSRLDLSSANSINVARLVPQASYYAAAAAAVFGGRIDPDGEATPRSEEAEFPAPPPFLSGGKAVTFCVPSGNFGNLTAGLYAMKMGAPIALFIAATNINKTVPDYLETGNYQTRTSQPTISNAMDVGAPSNFERMAAHWSHGEMQKLIRGISVSDDATRDTISRVHRSQGYFLDPHGAVGWRGAEDLQARENLPEPLAVLATAHPAKFAETVEPLTGPIPVPQVLQDAMKRSVTARTIPADIAVLTELLGD
jgi:threonine synthase